MNDAPFIELQRVDSTNNYATALAHAGMARHGLAVFAHEQTRGKGQRNKTWLTGKGENIALSTVMEPRGLTLSQSFVLSMAVALAARQCFSRYAGTETKIKWPNDIYWGDRKAGGILIENILQGPVWKFAVAGIGLNINQTEFPELETKAVSLKSITGKHYDAVQLAKELRNDVQYYFEQLLNNAAQVVADYHTHLYKKGEKVKLKKGVRVFEATIKEVTPQGMLVVQHGAEEQFSVGEVEWVL